MFKKTQLLIILIVLSAISFMYTNCADQTGVRQKDIAAEDSLFISPKSLAQQATRGNARFNIGVSRIDITPTEEVVLAGSPNPKATNVVGSRLYVRAMVISAGSEIAAIVTIDTLKYKGDWAFRAQQAVAARTSIPRQNVLIAASHTHSAPLFYRYEDRLVDTIAKAVDEAVHTMEPCTLGVATRSMPGQAHNRRVMIGNEAYNTWRGYDHTVYPWEAPIDNDVTILAAETQNGRYKAILYSYGVHPVANHPNDKISADYPGLVESHVQRRLGYDVPTLFMLGASGNVNPNNTTSILGVKLGNEILAGLGDLKEIAEADLVVSSSERLLPGRKQPHFDESDVLAKWPQQFDHLRGPLMLCMHEGKKAIQLSLVHSV